MSKRAVRLVRTALGKRVRDLRLGLGLSQSGLAARCRLSSKFIGEVERGQKSISVDSLYRVARALGVSLADLVNGLGRRSSRAAVKSTGGDIAEMLRQQRPPELRRALRMLQVLFAKK